MMSIEFVLAVGGHELKTLLENPKTLFEFDDNNKLIISVPDIQVADPKKEFRVSLANTKITVDPNNGHRLLSYSYNILGTAFQVNAKIICMNQNLSGVVIRNELPDKYLSVDRIDIEKIDYNAKVNPVDFRITKYGLPEPEGVVWERPRPLWHWLLGGVILASLLAVLFRVWARRARLKTVTPSPPN